ncbi:MAG TPA: alpha-L-rhamnosidase C-terminal domain-containing protein [Chitinophagaceae bacterium]|nr:alpha-L-rhamnosidase C-terminal domain-containing protein [Chitinophagaceae bacterium]
MKRNQAVHPLSNPMRDNLRGSGRLTIRLFPLIFILLSGNAGAQGLPLNPDLLSGPWSARWICCPRASPTDYGVYHFRKCFLLEHVPGHFIIHVSADNRYVLYVNGHYTGRGPARGDLYNWNFESFDITPYLHTGKNVLAAEVWNMGIYAPVAQISARTGFLVQGNDPLSQVVNTDSSWKAWQDTAYQPCATHLSTSLHTYIVTGPGDRVNGSAYPWGWSLLHFNDNSWLPAEIIPATAVPAGYGTDNTWTLSSSPIPQMTQVLQRFARIRRSSPFQVKDSFILGDRPLLIPANDSVTILVDQGKETVAYPQLVVSGGRGSLIRLVYAESLVDSLGSKGNRNSVKGKTISGLYDLFFPDGGPHRLFSPLWIRTYRYLQLGIRTSGQPLRIDDLYGIYAVYPFSRRASFSCNDSSLEKIWNTAWRTARLCAGETYFDCPYYEQLQYEADTRIQALITLYNTSDDRLVLKAIHDFADSRVPCGLTEGRFPSHRLQVIPPFSLLWISMLHDYWMYRPDNAFLEQYLDQVRDILGWYSRHIDPAVNMLGPMKWWNFTDWTPAFKNGVPEGATHGHSAVITLQLAITLRQAADLFRFFHRKGEARKQDALADRLAQSVYHECFDSSRMEMANTPDKRSFSQHASIMALLADAIPAGEEDTVMMRILQDSSLSQASFYYRFYLDRALEKTGLADLYYAQLNPWRKMIAEGLTTFAETPEPTRSDCHGWSASPAFDFLHTICGIRSSSAGFRQVRIVPALGGLNEIRATMPLPEGEISLWLRRSGKSGIRGEIELPPGLGGQFIWNGQKLSLHPGNQTIRL